MSYLIGYGLGPYFTQQTVKELVDGNSYFTLQFDRNSICTDKEAYGSPHYGTGLKQVMKSKSNILHH